MQLKKKIQSTIASTDGRSPSQASFRARRRASLNPQHGLRDTVAWDPKGRSHLCASDVSQVKKEAGLILGEQLTARRHRAPNRRAIRWSGNARDGRAGSSRGPDGRGQRNDASYHSCLSGIRPGGGPNCRRRARPAPRAG